MSCGSKRPGHPITPPVIRVPTPTPPPAPPIETPEREHDRERELVHALQTLLAACENAYAVLYYYKCEVTRDSLRAASEQAYYALSEAPVAV